MATGKLLGTDVAGANASIAGWAQGSQFIAAASGKIEEIYVYCVSNDNVRVAIYPDSGANTPTGSPLSESAPTAVTAGAWRAIPLAFGVSVTGGMPYWLCFQVQIGGGCAYRALANTRLRCTKSQAYGAFPSGADYSIPDDDYEYSLQGYGILVLTPTGISQPVAIGEPEVQQGSAAQTVTPAGIEQAIAIGQPALTYPQDIAPSGIEQAIAIGEPEVQQGSAAQTITPAGIEQAVAIGEPALTYPQDIAPSGIEQAIACGTPLLVLTDNTFEAIIENLLPETTYIFRAVAKNTAGQGEGETLEFITLAIPLPPTNFKKVLVTHPAIKEVKVLKDGEQPTAYENLSNLDEQRIENAIEFPVLTPVTVEVTTLANQVFTFDVP